MASCVFLVPATFLPSQPAPSSRSIFPSLAASVFYGRPLLHTNSTSNYRFLHAPFPHSPPFAAVSQLPLTDIPGTYGPPLLGALSDRLNYFWFQGTQEFFETRIKNYGTVFRVNMPPGPPFFPDGRVIMLLNPKSFRVLFDMSKVEKKDVFAGTYMPSVEFTGGYRVLPYLDPSEKKHAPLKDFCFHILKSNARSWLPEFHQAFTEAAAEWEGQLAKQDTADFSSVCDQFTLNFLLRTVLGRDPSTPGEASLGRNGPSYITVWLALQLAPQTSSGLPKLLDELLLHTFPLPFALGAFQYNKLYEFFQTHGKHVLDIAGEKFGLGREEACHNLLFFLCFNTWGGIKILFPSIFKRIWEKSPGLQRELADEVRRAERANGGLNMKALEDMELVSSVVYEVLRIDPPVPYQYGRAKKDFILESYDAAYKVKKGELLGGFQPIAMKDPNVYQDPTSFQPKRFMGEKGKELLNYLFWSNGPETEEPAASNKQCAGKDFVIFIARLQVAEFYVAYDSFEGVIKGTTETFSFTSLKKRTF